MTRATKTIAFAAALGFLGLGAYALAQSGPGFGPGFRGMGHGMGHGGGHGMGMRHGSGGGMGMRPGGGGGMMGMMAGGSATPDEMGELHAMFVNHDRIRRSVTNLPNGIRTLTESDDPELAKVLISHVAGMIKRVDEGRDPQLPMQSPALGPIFRHRDKIKTDLDVTDKGITVTQTSDDPAVVEALQRHAADVSDLVERGMVAAHETMMRNAASGAMPRQ